MNQGCRQQVPVNVAARILGKSEATVRRLIREGKIDYARSSPRKTLINRAALEIFLEED